MIRAASLCLLVLALPAQAAWVHETNGQIDASALVGPPMVNGTSVAGWSSIADSDPTYQTWLSASAAKVAAVAQAQEALSAGMRVTSTSAPAEDGTYAVDSGAQLLFTAAYASCGIRAQFPDGTTANYTWYDIAGTGHTVPDCAHMTALAAAASAFVSQVLHGQLPTQPVSLP